MQSLIEEIRELGDKNKYKEQGEAFLKACGVALEVKQAVPQVAPRWAKDGKHGIQWSVELGKYKEKPSDTVSYWGTFDDNRMHMSSVIQFFFWGSIRDKEDSEHRGMKHKPTAYSILAGLYSPVDSFKDFCANFGYSEDSMEALKTYDAVKEQNEKLESIFTSEELEALSEIA